MAEGEKTMIFCEYPYIKLIFFILVCFGIVAGYGLARCHDYMKSRELNEFPSS